ncbi:MAG: hypothetical protein L6R38_006409 [Xanthoria sp. 2 TBL-2021]|nr:MAG: hypothetical protein L6R38_006409 [Xanthoria sp. 2 TBL-2021]
MAVPNPRYRNLVLPGTEIHKLPLVTIPIATLIENFSSNLDAPAALAEKTESYGLHLKKLERSMGTQSDKFGKLAHGAPTSDPARISSLIVPRWKTIAPTQSTPEWVPQVRLPVFLHTMDDDFNQPTTPDTRKAVSQEMADLPYPNHILALPDDIVDRLPLLSKPSSILIREGAYDSMRGFSRLLVGLVKVLQSWTVLQQVSTNQLGKISATAFDGDPEAIKQFANGVRDASTKVKEAVEDVLRLSNSVKDKYYEVMRGGQQQH